MNRRNLIFIPLLLAAALFAGCGMFEANPVISSFTASATTVDAGDTVTFTVKGSTKDANVDSDLVDYSGKISIVKTSGGEVGTLDVKASEAEDFTKNFTITFSAGGTYTYTVTLTSGDNSTTSESITITVNDPKPWDDADVGEPYTISSTNSWVTGYSVGTAGDTDWFKFKTSSSYYVVHWADKYDNPDTQYTADVKVTVYNAAGDLITGPQDAGCWTSSPTEYGTGKGIRASNGTDYTSGEYIYIKVQGYYSTSTGTYALYIY